RGLHTGHARDGVAEGGALARVQFLAGQHRDRARQRFGVVLQRGGGDLDRGQLGQVVALFVGGIGRVRGGQGGGERQEQGAADGAGSDWSGHIVTLYQWRGVAMPVGSVCGSWG